MSGLETTLLVFYRFSTVVALIAMALSLFGGILAPIVMAIIAYPAIQMWLFSRYIYKNYDFISENKIALFLSAMPIIMIFMFLLSIFLRGIRVINMPDDSIIPILILYLPWMFAAMIVIEVLRKRAEIKEMMQEIKEIQEKRNTDGQNEENKPIFKD